MPTATLACPHCSQNLKTTRPFDVGSRFRCPRCGASFAARPEDVPAAARATAYGVRPLPPPTDEAPRGSGAWVVLLGVVGLGLLLLVGAGVALTLHFLPKDSRQASVQPASSANAGRPRPEGSTDIPDNKDQPKPLRKPVDLPPSAPPPDLSPDPPSQAWLPPEEQEKVNAAIDHGRDFLMKTQQGNGSWPPSNYTVGMAALPGLTLLECGVPATDSHVVKAAEVVRQSAPFLGKTYELALAILFLDRLGDPQDESLIRVMAVRLLAGEAPSGGWTYDCPVLSEEEEGKLWTILEATRPQSSLELMATKTGDNGPTDLFTGRPGDKTQVVKPGGATIPLSPGPSDEVRTQVKQMYDGLSPQLKAIPALKPPMRNEQMPQGDNTDNSNTQFATLGLWAAGRHGVPMERGLALLAKRFQVTQEADGSWGYQYRPGGGNEFRPAMTGAGLLGLAVGHGLTADQKAPEAAKEGEDPLVEKGMTALGSHVAAAKIRDTGELFAATRRNYYFLWSVERVGVLYNRRIIGREDWYPWGANALVEMQAKDGSWRNGAYWGASAATDTSFSLLFLKRANLAKDLTTKLEFLSRVKEP